MPKTLFLDAPENFSFRQTIYSHGWCELSPFEIDDVNWRLSYVFTDKKPFSATLFEADGKLNVEVSDGKINAATEAKILRDTRHILRLDDDLSEFYKNLKK